MRRSILAELLAVVLIVVVTVLLRSIHLDESLWNDEVSTYSGAILPLKEVFLYRPHYLYYVLAHLTLQIQDSELMLRMPSVVGGCLGVLALYGFARQSGGRWVGLLSALFLAISAFHIDRSHEARFYAIVMLASILMTWSLWRAVESNKLLPWLAFAVFANLGLMMQMTVLPYFMVLLAAAAVWTVITRRNEGARAIGIRLACLCIAAALGMGGFAAGAIAQRQVPDFVVDGQDTGDWDADGEVRGFYQRADDLQRPVYRLTPGQYGGYLRDFMPGTRPVSKMICTGLFLIGVLSLFRQRPLPAYLIVAQFIVVPLPFFVVTVSHWFMDRYFCSVYPFYYLFLAVGIESAATGVVRLFARIPASDGMLRRRYGSGLMTAAVALALALFLVWVQVGGVRDYLVSGPPNDWRAVARFLADRIEPGDTIAYARSSAKRTAGLPIEQQVYPKSSWPLEFYLRRELKNRRSQDAPDILDFIRFRSASTVDDVIDLKKGRGRGTTYVVSRGGGSPIVEARRRLRRIAPRDLLRVGGLTVSIVDKEGVISLREEGRDVTAAEESPR